MQNPQSPLTSIQYRISRLDSGKRETVPDDVAAEEPLEIRVEGHPLAVVMRTPGHDRELAAGFLLSEGVIKSAKDVFDIATCVSNGESGKGNAVDTALAHPGTFEPSKLTRHVFTSASCGVCSKTTIAAVMRRRKSLASGFAVSAGTILSLPRKLSRKQETFRRTGGLHACALFDGEGNLLCLREDVGRHNALDKLIGWALLEKRLPLTEHIVLLSGRASFEMMQKSHAASIPVVAAISAPSSLAVDFAREAHQTLLGFVRSKSMNIYSAAERITS